MGLGVPPALGQEERQQRQSSDWVDANKEKRGPRRIVLTVNSPAEAYQAISSLHTCQSASSRGWHLFFPKLCMS